MWLEWWGSPCPGIVSLGTKSTLTLEWSPMVKVKLVLKHLVFMYLVSGVLLCKLQTRM